MALQSVGSEAPQFYQLLRYIDARDSVNKWCTAKVINIEEGLGLTIRFDGWSSKWDERVSFKSSRIAPFRLHSRLYSGQPHTAIREWSFSLEELSAMERRISDLCGCQLALPSAYETTQFLRGDFFILIDCLLTNTYQGPEVSRVIAFFTKVIDLALCYLQVPDVFKYYLQGVSNPDLFLTDAKVALAMAYNELFFSLERLMGGEERTGKFFKAWTEAPRDYEPVQDTIWNNKSSKVMQYFANYFAKKNGFRIALEILKRDKEHTGRIPLEILARIPLNFYARFLQGEKGGVFLSEWKAAVLGRLHNLGERDIKDFDKDVCMKILTSLQALVLAFDRNASIDFVEHTEMLLALILLKCQFLEKRIRGLNEFRELIQRTAPAQRGAQSIPAPRRITKTRLIEFMSSQNLLLTIIADRPHPEILRRSGEIFGFFAENNLLSQNHLDILWASRSDKHETYIRAVYEVLITISSSLNSDLKDSLFQRFSEVPIDQYDEKYLRVLKDFSQNAVSVTAANPKVRSDVTNDFALPKFFSLMLDDPKTLTPLADLSTDLLLDLLKSPSFKGRQEEYLELAIDNVVNRKESIPQSLRLILGILRPPGGTLTRALNEQMKKLERKFGLVQAAVDSLIAYLDAARCTPPSSPDSIISGRYCHSLNLSSRLSFLEFVLEYNDKARISLEHLSSLWSAFILHPSIPYDADIYFEWLAGNVEGKGTLGRDVVESVFEKWLCAGRLPTTEAAFNCFMKYFLYVNSNKKRIDSRGSCIVAQRLQADVLGFAPLVDIALGTDNEIVSDRAIKLIVDLHLKLGKPVVVEKERLWTDFLSKFIGIIAKIREKRITAVYRILKIFELCLDEAEGKARKCTQKPATSGYMTVFFKRMSDTDFRKFQLNVLGTIGDVRRKIADLMQVSPNFVYMSIMNRPYGRSDDDIEVNTFKTSMVVLIDTSRSITDLVDPKPLMSNHSDLSDTLFDLIAQSETAELAWSLLMRLPTNEKIKEPIKRLEPNWFRYLNKNSLHRLLYCLIIIDELSDQFIDFCDQFEEKKGISHIVRVFFESRLEEQHSSALTLKYALVVFKLLQKFLPPQGYEPDSIINRTLSLLLEISNSLMTSAESQPEAVETVKYASELLVSVISKLQDKQTAVINILNYRHLDELLSMSLLRANNMQFREGMKSLFFGLCKKLQIETEILGYLLELLPRSLVREDSGSAFFQLTAKLVKDANESLHPRFQEVQTLLVAELKGHKCERNASEKDEVLSGVLTVLRAVIKKLSSVVSPELVTLVLHTCLFEVPSAGRVTSTVPPKCKHSTTRTEALKLLSALTLHSEGSLTAIVTYLDKLHQDPHWRTSRKQDWNIHQATMERSQTGFVGIKNLGCTCYMGSILQQLFMVETFREGILAVDVERGGNDAEDLLYQLQNVFAALQESDKQYVNPKGLTKAFKSNEGQPFNPMEQMDVDEFFNNFMDKLEAQIKPDMKSKSLIQDHFGGLQTTELIGKGSCSHRSERAEPFLTLPLEVKNKKSIYESLDSFVQGEVLEGDNAYQCDHCEAKVTAERRVCIQHLPNTMIFALRRFDFNLDTMSRLKLNDYCEFPMEIDLEPYTVEGLNRKDALKEENKDAEGQVMERQHPDDYYQYKLRGVVIHMGTAESGHYYSFIADTHSGCWFEFNDTQVREFDPKEIPTEAFGGEERWSVPSGYGSPVVSLREKYRNAYLLFYERSGVYQRRAPDEDTLTPLQFSGKMRLSTNVLKINQQVLDDNEQFWRRRNAFCPEYFDFLLKLSKLHSQDVEMLKFLISFFLTILIRSKDRHRAEELHKAVHDGLTSNPDVSYWLLEMLTVEPVTKELLMDCPEAPMRKLVVSFSKVALRCVTAEQQRDTAVRLLRSLSHARKPMSRHYAQYFEFMDSLVGVSPDLWGSLQLSTRLLSHLFDDKLELPELQPPPEYTNTDIYLGYSGGDVSEAVAEKFQYAVYELGSSNTYIYKILARFPEKLTEEEVRKYFAHKPSMAYMVKDANTRIGSRCLANVFAVLCKDNQALSTEYCKSICTLISELEFDHHKPLYRQLASFLKIRDNFIPQRTEFSLTLFLSQMKENINYIKATELSLEFLYKLYCSLTTVQEWFACKKGDLRFLEEWVKRAQNYGYLMPTASNMTLYKQKGTSASATSNSRPNSDKIDLAKKLIRGETPMLSYMWDSDEDFAGRELKFGDRVDVVNTAYMRWDRATIVQCFGDVVQVRLEFDKTSLWVERDGDMIACDSPKPAAKV